MSQFGNDKTTTPKEILAREAEGEKRRAELVAESKSRLAPRCPECGSIGTLELIEGVMRCIDCDEVLATAKPLAGMGRA
jgi:hypothetical protein